MSNGRIAVGFLLGATVGAAVSYIVTKRVIQAKCDQEIEEVREYYSNPDKKTIEDIKEKEEEVNDEVEEPERKEKPDLAKMAARVRYDRVLNSSGYGSGGDYSEEDEKVLPDVEIIDENDFVHSEYERRSMTYYVADDTLVDDDDGEVIEDVSATITREALNHFVDGVLHVRNNKTLTDYEIEEDPRSYESVQADLY